MTPGWFGITARDLDRVLDRFRSSRQEDRLVWRASADQAVQPLREPDIRSVSRHLERHVADLADLGAHGLDHPRVAVADIEDADPAHEVEIAPALRVPDLGALRALDRDRVRRHDPPWNVAGGGIEEGLAVWVRGGHWFRLLGVRQADAAHRPLCLQLRRSALLRKEPARQQSRPPGRRPAAGSAARGSAAHAVMSISTLLLRRLARTASRPRSLPIPERL